MSWLENVLKEHKSNEDDMAALSDVVKSLPKQDLPLCCMVIGLKREDVEASLVERFSGKRGKSVTNLSQHKFLEKQKKLKTLKLKDSLANRCLHMMAE